ncbi:MAG: GWxTD domain-containing protein [Rhizobacter sp.]|nr:GWxTD domain-containing protein [Chlorobiales bacterium]
MLKKSLACGLLPLLSVMIGLAAAQAQPKSALPMRTVRIADYVDYATFKADSGKTYLEAHLALPRQVLKFVKKENKFLSQIEMTLIVSLKIDSTQKQTLRNTLTSEAADSADMQRGQLVNVMLAKLSSGDYTVRYLFRDLNAQPRTYEVESQVAVPRYDSETIQVSDLELAREITKSTNQKSPFYKNTLEVIPNPSGVFFHTEKLQLYAELYNLNAKKYGGEFVYLHSYLTKGRDTLSETDRRKRKTRTSSSVVHVETFELTSLPSGAYTLTLEVTDSAFSVLAASSKGFHIYNPVSRTDSVAEVKSTAGAGYEKSVYAEMTNEISDDEIAKLRYIASEAERQVIDKLSSTDDRRRFLYNFWLKRGTIFRRQYLERVALADKDFSSSYMKGWLTDRGRVLLVYGNPTNLDRFEGGSANAKPYQIWTYDKIEGQGNAIFVFADRSGFGQYELIHSTARNEYNNANWERQVQAN